MIKVIFIILSICAFALADDLTDAVGTTTVETLVSTTVPVIVTEPVVQATIESPVVETKEESPAVETKEESAVVETTEGSSILLSTIAPVENDLSSNSTLTNGTLKGVLKKVQQNLKQSVDQSLTVNSGGVTSQRCFMFLISFVLLFVFL